MNSLFFDTVINSYCRVPFFPPCFVCAAPWAQEDFASEVESQLVREGPEAGVFQVGA